MWKFALKGRAGDAGAAGEQGEQGDEGEQGEQGVPGDFNYTDRGDPSSADFSGGTIVKNGAWHDLDLSGIVGEAHRLVLMRVFAESDYANDYILFRTNGNVNTANTSRLTTQNDGVEIEADLWIWTDAAGVIEYWVSDSDWNSLEIFIRGWVEPTP